jgi:membrane protease YdiL (CAAX protease family)
MAALQVALLFVLGLLLRRKPTAANGGLMAGALFIAISGNATANASVGRALSALLFYVFFLGFGEELLFRGYIQSRLNMAFGRPFAFFGVPWGWGALIASALFALMHALNLGSLAIGDWQPTPWWALWTFPGGLALAFVREKTGSIVAPTLLHGLPQGIGYALMGL